jgi:hypothetical protein
MNNVPRLPEPKEEMPNKIFGILTIEEAWLGFEGKNFKFFSQPGYATIMMSLRYFYEIGDGEAPYINAVQWQSPGEEHWQTIPDTNSHQVRYLYIAAEEFLKNTDIAPQFERWIEDNFYNMADAA